jgi:uncharacterized protein YqgV (UPF0045/DUF77 family)
MIHKVNVALQVLPYSKDIHPYKIVDAAIKIIEDSGIKYRVCPFETVMEGDYDEIMEIVKKIQVECLNSGADSMISNLKIQVDKFKNVSIEDITGKYDEKNRTK